MARSKKKSKLQRWSTLLRSQLSLPAAFLLLWLLAQLEPWLYLGALASELGFQLAIVTGLAAIWAVARRAPVTAAALMTVSAMFAAPLAPFYGATRPTPQTGPLLHVASAHLAGEPLTASVLANWLAREHPDALALTGLRTDGLGQTNFLSYRVARGSSHGSLLLVQNALAVPQRDALREQASVALRAGRCQARVIALELPPLARYTELAARAQRIDAARALPSAPRSVWLGQYGSRAESHDLRAFLAAHQLRNASVGHGRLATAPASLGPLGFPLAHVLVHGWISVREANTEPALVPGAHRVLTAVLELTEPRCRVSRDVSE